MQEKNNKRTIWAWCMFDWANQSYNMVITSTIFPSYYVGITRNKANGDTVSFFGHRFVNTVLSNYILALSYLVVVALLPILTSIADYRGNKRLYLQLFTWLGSLSCAGLFMLQQGKPLEFPMICFGLASIGYCGGFVFYNSYLPQIATVDQQDAVSAKGFIYGYVGSIVVQLICFVFVLFYDKIGITQDRACQISFLVVFVWWIGFSFIAFRRLPKGWPNAGAHNYNVLTGGFKELAKVFGKIRQMPLLKRFLSAFFFYSVGVQTIMLVAANFAAKELHMPDEHLIVIILIIQVVAVGGAVVASKSSEKFGNTTTLVWLVTVWTVLCACVSFITTEAQFFVAAAVVGVVMGGVQSLSRSTYSKYLPPNIPDTASFFSFYDVTEKLSIVVGLFCFGYVESRTHQMRVAALTLDGFFALGLILLVALLVKEVKKKRNTVEAVA
ncbi:UMF1 family MFS transporter [Mucilaginibacter yixingensis]|uniref:UMF1 family MFS transporter n=1 Tax=Mucilaginibacter yixingensis TaxID=1295612 RepID=A0A2T5JF85_9SPHI|nr:MFS transporter [Mucilaginibacter yixingensis]PTR01065.1 UMF1 family MFS transporter [Mucilaginibacter yixingensis]